MASKCCWRVQTLFKALDKGNITANISCHSTALHLITLPNYRGRLRVEEQQVVPRLQLNPFWESSVSAADSPDTHRHGSRLAGCKGGKHSAEKRITAQLVCAQPDLCCTPGKGHLLPGAAPQTSDLPPGFCCSLGHGSCKETPFSYKHSSRAGSDPPRGSVPGIAPFPRCCQGIRLGAVCSCSSSVMHSVLRRD